MNLPLETNENCIQYLKQGLAKPWAVGERDLLDMETEEERGALTWSSLERASGP